MRSRMLLVCSLALTLALSAAVSAETLEQKVDPWVLDTASRGDTEFLVMLRWQADLRGAKALSKKTEKGAFVMDALRSHAASTQKPLLDLLSERGASHRSYWVANMIWVRGSRALVEELAAREDVFHVYANPTVHFDGPVASLPSEAMTPEAIEWNVLKVHAPEAWELGFTGQGIVVGGADTGYDWQHPALKGKYRGWDGSVADHNYSWHDTIQAGGGVCGAPTQAPCDDFGHGTHTMGTMVGDDGGANQIGVAPGAKWIGCRNMDQGDGTPERYSECFQWFIAPTDLQGLNPNPAKAPHVINNSWSCTTGEGCTDPLILQTIVESTRAAGIEVVVSAGNSGSACNSVSTPAAIYDASFSVGATDSSDDIAAFSSRGAVTIDGSGRLKPDISAPGVGVRSSVPNNGYAVFEGTSMAGPHVAGIVALLLSASPDLIQDPDGIELAVTSSAVPRTSTQTCDGVPGSAIPNNTYGWGRADALGAITASGADLAIAQSDSPDPTVPGVSVTDTITVSNLGPRDSNATLVAGFTLSATVDSATPSQGNCVLGAHSVNCDLGSIAGGAQATVDVVITPTVVGMLTETAGVTGSALDFDSSNNDSLIQTTVEDCPTAAPALTAPSSVAPDTAGLNASVSTGAGHTPVWTLTGGTITGGQGTDQITFTSGAPGTTMNLEVADSIAGCDGPPASATISVDFLDVPPAHPFHDFVNTVARNGVTAGCGNGNYCPDAAVTRAQMAVFLLKSKYGASHVPPPATGTVFTDVPQGSFAADWIEELASLGVTGGCGSGNYCPDAPVTRAQMAVFLLKTLEDPGYAPPPATGTVFADVHVGDFGADWIEELASRGVSGGCGGGNYCPGSPNTRGQMAVFLVRTFDLQ